jgi:serine/threonine protein kinase
MAIARGATLGPYEILAHIGAGGMGEVWRARDQRIGRDVAVKVLSGSYAAGDERVRRFEQEARAAGALNHPGLVTIFDVGATDGSPYIVMELLDGQTVRDALGGDKPTPLPLRRAVDYAIQIASALAVAHEKGVIHRDLKPENLFVTGGGRVKILDFGLAKLAEGAKDADPGDRTARHLTSAGMVVGTPNYMSPEQVRALPLDHRTDIFSFGVVLYEMLSGRRVFEYDSAVETMTAVLNDEPPSLVSLDPQMPPALDAIVRRCLEKNPRERFQSALDLAFQLRMLPELQKSRSAVVPAGAASKRPPYRGTAAVTAALVLAGAGLAFYSLRGNPQPSLRTYEQLTFGDAVSTFPTLSPDGKSFAFVSSESGDQDIYVQPVDARMAINITADSADDESEPVFSPDGARIAFRSERDGGGIFVMGVTGESVRRLSDFGHNPSWSPDGTRLVVSTSPVALRPHTHGLYGELWILDTRTGEKKPLVQPRVGGPDFGRNSDAVQPSWSPHGKRIAFWGFSTWQGQRDIWTIDPDAPQPKRTVVRVTSDPVLHWNPVWSPDGKYLYFGSDSDGTLNLWRIPVDEDTGKPVGAAEPVALPASISGNFSFSQRGDLVYATVTRSYRLLALPFEAKSGSIGEPRPLLGGAQEILTFKPSPDGKLVAYTTTGTQEDLFVANADGTHVRQFTNDAARDRGVTWSGDGKMLYFFSNRGGTNHIWSIHADGSSLGQVTEEAGLKRIGAHSITWPDVSPDGRTLSALTDRGAVFVHLDRPLGQRIEPFTDDLPAPLRNISTTWSPDGTRIVGDAGSSATIYTLQTRRFITIPDLGSSPQWLPDSKHLVFFDKGKIAVLDVESGKAVRSAVTPPPGVELENAALWPRVSNDGATLYVPQTLEQSNIWMLRFRTR